MAGAQTQEASEYHHAVNPPTQLKTPPPEMKFEFVLEDPSKPQTFREKRHRSRHEIEKQREDIRQLKEFGGACEGCRQSKKKCSTANPCPHCVASNRECIRREPKRADSTDSADTCSSIDPDMFDGVLEDVNDTTPWDLVDSIDGGQCEFPFAGHL